MKLAATSQIQISEDQSYVTWSCSSRACYQVCGILATQWEVWRLEEAMLVELRLVVMSISSAITGDNVVRDVFWKQDHRMMSQLVTLTLTFHCPFKQCSADMQGMHGCKGGMNALVAQQQSRWNGWKRHSVTLLITRDQDAEPKLCQDCGKFQSPEEELHLGSN